MKLKLSKKGMMPIVGSIIALMVAVIVGVGVVLPVIQEQITAADSVTATTETLINATDGAVVTLAAGDLIANSFVAVNGTNGVTIPAANYTVTLGSQGTAGTVTWAYTGSGGTTGWAANVSYTVYDASYIKNRTVVTLLELIPLFLVLAILIAAVLLIKM